MVLIGSARHDENYNYSGGRAGNQTGNELEIQEWYLHSKGWRVLRAKDSTVRKRIADNMEFACANPHIGYDQNENYTLWDVVKDLGFDCRLVDTNCETDCARLVRVCVAYAGIKTDDFYTASEAEALLSTGQFDEYPFAATNPDLLVRGDILVTKTKGHTVIVIKQTNQYEEEDGTYVIVMGEIKMGAKYKLENVKLGSEGNHVLLVQEILRSRGFRGADDKVLTLDGKAGDNTMFAVKSYIEDRAAKGVDLGSSDAWGPRCWADQGWPTA